MNTQAQVKPAENEVLLTILTGPEAGVAYKLVGQTITIGRAPENDVVLQDNKSSRQHAKIERRGLDYYIVDLDSKTGLSVNGNKLKDHLLKQGDQIIIGETMLKFGSTPQLSLIHSTPPVSQLPLTKNLNLALPPPAPIQSPMQSSPTSWSPPPLTKQNKQGLGVVAVIVVLVIGFIFMNSNSMKSKSFKLKDEEVIAEQIESTEEANTLQLKEIELKGKNTQQYTEAQAFYLRGFREFREGNYARAIQNFEAAIALYPSHPLAKRYLERARLKKTEMITAALERAERAYQLQKYGVALNEYKTVMHLTGKDPNNKSFQLAEKRTRAIELILMNNR